MKCKYTVIFIEKEDQDINGYFPDLKDCTVTGKNLEEFLDNAREILRKYCIKNVNNLPQETPYFKLRRSFPEHSAYTLIVSFDEYHDGEHDLSIQVAEEFHEFIKDKNIEKIEDYIKRYYHLEEAQSAKFLADVIYYYCIINPNPDKADEAIEFHSKVCHEIMEYDLPDYEVVDYLYEIGERINLIVLLLGYADDINRNPNSKYYGDFELLIKVYKFLAKINDEIGNKEEREKYLELAKKYENPKIEVRDVNLDDKGELRGIGELIYLVDHWVYPDLFDYSLDVAKDVAPYLLRYDTAYNHKFIKVITYNDELAGFMLLLDKYPMNNNKEMVRAFMDSVGFLPKKFDKVIAGYFDELAKGWVGTQVVSLSIMTKFRRKHLAQILLDSLDEKTTYTLACVRDNLGARKLYEKAGFKYSFEYPGYTGIPCVELIREGK